MSKMHIGVLLTAMKVIMSDHWWKETNTGTQLSSSLPELVGLRYAGMRI